jgi:hypothetical protein
MLLVIHDATYGLYVYSEMNGDYAEEGRRVAIGRGV